MPHAHDVAVPEWLVRHRRWAKFNSIAHCGVLVTAVVLMITGIALNANDSSATSTSSSPHTVARVCRTTKPFAMAPSALSADFVAGAPVSAFPDGSVYPGQYVSIAPQESWDTPASSRVPTAEVEARLFDVLGPNGTVLAACENTETHEITALVQTNTLSSLLGTPQAPPTDFLVGVGLVRYNRFERGLSSTLPVPAPTNSSGAMLAAALSVSQYHSVSQNQTVDPLNQAGQTCTVTLQALLSPSSGSTPSNNNKNQNERTLVTSECLTSSAVTVRESHVLTWNGGYQLVGEVETPPASDSQTVQVKLLSQPSLFCTSPSSCLCRN